MNKEIPEPPKPINDTTYEVELPFGDKVEIGDRGAADFKPHIKLNRWDGECFIKVELPTTEKVSPIVERGKVKFKGKDIEAHFYPLEPRTVIVKDKGDKEHKFPQNELGGFEFKIVLGKKPATNKIVLDIETQGLIFCYQPPLTPEEIDMDCTRPDNVVGSYAVYHATRGNMHRGKADAEKYKCGKAFHIYRPRVKDAVGNETWADLSLSGDKLTITIDDAWLDAAVYPVSIDPEFGYHVIGGSTSTGYNSIGGYVAAPAGPGNADEIVAYTDERDGIQGALYIRTGEVFVDSTIQGTIANDGEDWLGWHAVAFTVPPAIIVQNYIVCYNNYYSYARYYDQDIVFTNGTLKSEINYGTWPDPLDQPEWGYQYRRSVYCTYTAGELPAGLENKSAGMAAKMVATRLI